MKTATDVGQPDRTTHADNFDLIRLIAASLVIYGHSYHLTGYGVLVPNALGSSISSLAVKVFFVLSGYLVSESWRMDPSPVRYLMRRALRIFPGLLVVVFIAALVVGPVLTHVPVNAYFSAPNTWAYFWNVALYPVYMLPGLFDGNPYPSSVNGSLWSLPAEFSMYLCVPLVLWPGPFLRIRAILAALAFCIGSIHVVHQMPQAAIVIYGTSLTSTMDAAPYFLLGAAWRIAGIERLYNLQIAALLVALLAAVPSDAVEFDLALFLVLPYAVIAFGRAQPAFFKSVGRFGDFSYGIYLYGFLVQQVLCQLLPFAGHPLRLSAFALPVSVGLAALSWHFVEKPCLKLKPGRRLGGGIKRARRDTGIDMDKPAIPELT